MSGVVPARAPEPRLGGLHVLADDDPRWKRDPVEIGRAACAGGAAVVQLRAKLATDSEALAWGEALRRITREAGALFFVNDRFDLALAVEADGVHLGQEDLPPRRIPEALRERLLVGRSTHTSEQLRAACAEPVDYVAFGPVFQSGSKAQRYGARGVDALSRAVSLVAPRPLVAIGGIDGERLPRVRRAGAAGFAVIAAVAAADDPEAAARDLAGAWQRAAVHAP